MPGNDELPQNGGVPLINFQDYMKQERDLREEADKKLYDARVEADEHAQADNSIKHVPPRDGTTPQGVRDWLKEIQHTTPYSKHTVYITAQSATGTLCRDIEFFSTNTGQ